LNPTIVSSMMPVLPFQFYTMLSKTRSVYRSGSDVNSRCKASKKWIFSLLKSHSPHPVKSTLLIEGIELKSTLTIKKSVGNALKCHIEEFVPFGRLAGSSWWSDIQQR
jgi:hypothetical protein